MMRHTSVAVLALVGLSACTSLAPAYQPPGLPVSTAFPASVGDARVAGAASAEQLADWRRYFTDDKLKALIAQALDNNRDLRVALLQIDKARALYQIQRAELLPAISADAAGTHQRMPASVSESGRSVLGREYSASVGLSNYELDLFGRVRSLKDAALQDYLATESAARASQISLVAEVANAYLAYAADFELTALARATQTNREAEYQLVAQRHRLGVASALDLSQARTGLESANVELARYQAQLAQDRNALVLLVGAPVDDASLPTQPMAALPVPPLLPAGLPSDLLLRRPDIMAAEHTLKGANANIGAARAAFFPSVSLTASLGSTSRELSGLFDSGSRSWSFMPQIRIPIFEGGRNLANLRGSEATQQIALANYDKTVQQAFAEVADALAIRDTLAARVNAQTALAEASALSHRLARARFEHGVDSFLAVLEAQRSDYSAQQGLIGIRLTEHANRIALYRALGGGGLR